MGDKDTIFALASAPGRAGIAVIRVSGPTALAAGKRLAGSLPDHGRGLRSLRTSDGALIDEALVLTFAAGRSFTGEAVVELHVHGGLAVVQAVLRVLAAMPGLRQAEPGEFTRRAMMAGRLDLAQVEGLADLIDAETEAQRRQAVRLMTGAMGEKAQSWRAAIIRAAALIEATIDFADEDVPVDVVPEVAGLISGVLQDMARDAAGTIAAERVRSGFEVAIIGPPNAGKSTLLNRLAGREAAITSSRAGTTRDVIEVRMDISGLPVTILDTAGLRETTDEVEAIGVDRARARAATADIRVHLSLDGAPVMVPVGANDIVVQAKGDLRGAGVSGLTGLGVDQLVAQIAGLLQGQVASVGAAMRDRHRLAIERAMVALAEARAGLPQAAMTPELVADALRQAARAVDALVGRIDVEDILGEIFSRFCIGK